MQLNVRTDHQVIPFDDNRMALFDNNTGTAIVTAERDQTQVWTVHADGVDDVTANNRQDAIQALIDQALASQPGTGFSTLVPHGLADLP